MDATRLPFHSTPCLSGGRYGFSSSNIHSRRLESRQATLPCKFGASAKAIRSGRSVVASFADDGHATYYQSSPRATCGGCSSREAKKTIKDKGGIGGRHSESKELKKKLKQVEGLLRSTVSTMVFGEETQGEPAASFAHDRVLAETAKRLILLRLQQVKAQEKEAKRRRKAEKAVKKAAACVGRKGMRMVDESESSSSTSSESSDSERPPVLDRCRLPGVEAALPSGGFVEERTEEARAKVNNNNNNNYNNNDDGGGDDEVAIGKPGSLTRITSSSSNNTNNNINNIIGGEGGRVKLEVCMGGKCQRSGAARLKAELERQVGLQAGTVVGCKCMGQCKHGPNVRLRHDYGERTPSPPKESQSSHHSSICCVGVGLEDVTSLVSSFILTSRHPRPLPA